MKKVVLVCNGGLSTSIMAKKLNDMGGNDYEEHLDGVDCVLIGPQIRYLLPGIQAKVGNDVPVEVIEPRTYGTMNVAKVVEQLNRMTTK